MGLGLIEAAAGAVVWALANAVYFDMKRKGTRGFRRFLAFWFGVPTTWAMLLLVPEGRIARVHPPLDDEASLLAEVRKDRARRIASGEERDEGSEGKPDKEGAR
jgi:hypothetical protein